MSYDHRLDSPDALTKAVVEAFETSTLDSTMWETLADKAKIQTIRLAQKEENKKLPLIQAPVWAALETIVAGDVRRHSNGQLICCVSIAAGAVTLASEPTFSGTALMQEAAGPAWQALGMASRVNADGYQVPTITADGTAPAGAAIRNLANVAIPGKALAGTIVGGSSYTDGTYTNVAFTGGSGDGATATIVVSSNAVSSVTINASGSGDGYIIGDILTAPSASIGGTGSAFTYTLTQVVQDNSNTPLTKLRELAGYANICSSSTVRGLVFNDGGNSSANQFGLQVYEFITDDPKPGLVFNGISAGIKVIITIDGYPAQENQVRFTGSGTGYYKFDWSGVRQERLYRIEVSGSTAIAGISLLAQSTLRPPSSDYLVGVLQSDSYGNSISTGPASAAYTQPLSKRVLSQEVFNRVGILGARSIVIGGTGYKNGKATADNNSTSTKFNCLAATENNPYNDIGSAVSIVFMHGLNDITLIVSDVVSNALASWQQRAAEAPNAIISIFGPESENSGPGATTLALDTALASAVSSWGYPRAVYHSIAQDDSGSWTSGTGRWGSTTGTGNADFYVGDDGVHPSLIGREYLVKRISEYLESDLQQFGY